MTEQPTRTLDLTGASSPAETPDVPTGAPAVAAPAAFDPDADFDAEMARAVPVPTVTLEVQMRPGWAVTYRTNVSDAEVKQWRADATPEGAGGVDNSLYSRFILARTCVQFVKDGKIVELADGSRPTFAALARKRKTTLEAAVQFWLDLDGAIATTSDVVYVESGYGRIPARVEVGDAGGDPTKG